MLRAPESAWAGLARARSGSFYGWCNRITAVMTMTMTTATATQRRRCSRICMLSPTHTLGAWVQALSAHGPHDTASRTMTVPCVLIDRGCRWSRASINLLATLADVCSLIENYATPLRAGLAAGVFSAARLSAIATSNW